MCDGILKDKWRMCTKRKWSAMSEIADGEIKRTVFKLTNGYTLTDADDLDDGSFIGVTELKVWLYCV